MISLHYHKYDGMEHRIFPNMVYVFYPQQK